MERMKTAAGAAFFLALFVFARLSLSLKAESVEAERVEVGAMVCALGVAAASLAFMNRLWRGRRKTGAAEERAKERAEKRNEPRAKLLCILFFCALTLFMFSSSFNVFSSSAKTALRAMMFASLAASIALAKFLIVKKALRGLMVSTLCATLFSAGPTAALRAAILIIERPKTFAELRLEADAAIAQAGGCGALSAEAAEVLFAARSERGDAEYFRIEDWHRRAPAIAKACDILSPFGHSPWLGRTRSADALPHVVIRFGTHSSYAWLLIFAPENAPVEETNPMIRLGENIYLSQENSVFLYYQAPRDTQPAWLANIVERVELPPCDVSQCLSLLGGALKDACGGEFSVSLDCAPPKLSFFVSDAAAAITNELCAQIKSNEEFNGIEARLKRAEFDGIEMKFISIKSLLEMVGECLQMKFDARENGVVFRLYPKELYVVEYARQLGGGCVDDLSFAMELGAIAGGHPREIECPDFLGSRFMTATKETHLEAWQALEILHDKINDREKLAAPAWIAETARLKKQNGCD
jgi:hypothetical protein